MNMNYSYLTTMYESILTKKYAFLVFFTFLLFIMKNILSKNYKNIFEPEICTYGENTFIHCSRITPVHIHVIFFSRIHRACHSDANGIKPGVNQK